jgi:Tfp pilus assembly protein PilO
MNIDMKNRQQFLMVLTIVAAGLFVGVNFVFKPLQNLWADRQMQIRQLHQKVTDGTQMIRREKYTRDDWKTMQDNALPANASDAEQQFLKALDGWARQSGAEVTSIMPQWKADATNYMTLGCRVEASGDLSALSTFIYNIEKGPTMVRLDEVELSSHDNSGQQMTLGLEINGLALLQNDKK